MELPTLARLCWKCALSKSFGALRALQEVDFTIYMLSSVLAGLAGIVFSFYTAAGCSLSAGPRKAGVLKS